MATHSSILAWRIPMDRGVWWATARGTAKSWTLLSDQAQHSTAQHIKVYVKVWMIPKKMSCFIKNLHKSAEVV